MALRSSSRDLNASAKPLPIIPRRTSSFSTVHSTANAELITNAPVKVTISRASPSPRASRQATSNLDSDASSSSEADNEQPNAHARRSKEARPASSSDEDAPPSRSTRRVPRTKVVSTPASLAPRPPIVRPEVLKVRSNSDPPVDERVTVLPTSISFSSTSPYNTRMIRKKSGEPLVHRHGTGHTESKSEPSTPNKAVHFDAKLEHVKLFIAEQKPLAVSRTGSPTDDTSGTESDFPSFIYGDSVRQVPIAMQLTNLPLIINVNADVTLEELKLTPDQSNIVGMARVRNLAFEKRLAARFTFDAWQTTSEVTAKYASSISDEFDRFSFTIRLDDIMARVEGKTIVAGRDIWDNNNDANYVATFRKASPPVSRAKPKEEELSSEGDVAVLHGKLQTVARKRDRERAAAASAPSMSKQISEPAASHQMPSSLSSRYDFSNSWRSSWNRDAPQAEPQGRRRSMVASIPFPTKQAEKALAFAKPTALGSPREPEIAGSTVSAGAFVNPELHDPEAMNTPGLLPRRHQRGYFDYSPLLTTDVRQTPPGTPKLCPRLASGLLRAERHSSSGSDASSPRLATPPGLNLGTAFMPVAPTEAGGESDASMSSVLSGDDSMLSIVSPSSGSSRSSSPCASDTSATSPDEDYSQFLNRFCFFTGANSVSPVRPPMYSRASSSPVTSFQQAAQILTSSSSATITPTPSTDSCFDLDDALANSTPRIVLTQPHSPTIAPVA
ncbi:putative phosphatase regulatory subunit-domain-containing protein [Schizophyllum amplum]|uniref:Putative phosphatase regulatory subunit-domain-containing protein n=1 Tax=Schizophyllum amplum TaxID=97359 RepID=A0A550C4Y0_9AGAR|nr:putative phosphatase regulatory subunit-domain-containing protein [Auriculariopsis ampla]